MFKWKLQRFVWSPKWQIQLTRIWECAFGIKSGDFAVKVLWHQQSKELHWFDMHEEHLQFVQSVSWITIVRLVWSPWATHCNLCIVLSVSWINLVWSPRVTLCNLCNVLSVSWITFVRLVWSPRVTLSLVPSASSSALKWCPTMYVCV